MGSRRRALTVGFLVSGLLLVTPGVVPAAPPPEAAGPPKRDFDVDIVSTRAEMVTGGDALVRIDVPRTVPPHKVKVSVEGRDVSAAFAPDPHNKRSLLGLVDGLELGDNTVEVRANGRGRGRPSADLTVTNHPITGPVFSGPQQTPFICQTEAFSLGSPLDDDCSAESKVEYVYRTTGGSFEPFDPDGPSPSDPVQTTTTEGDTVDYIVRLETGTINRAVYQIALLHQPGTPLPDPWTITPGWNGRLVYAFGGGCDAGYRQGDFAGDPFSNSEDVDVAVLDHVLLSPGFAVASSSQNVFGNNCNDITSAETAMMVKEYFSESFGVPDHIIGWGGSGGSMQQWLIAQNYPDILDGILPARGYPDIFSIVPSVTDCTLLFRAIDDGSHAYTVEQLAAITGYANNGSVDTCSRWMRFSNTWRTPAPCPGVIPSGLVYHPDSNPDGIRCSLYDNTVNALGIDPDTGFARNPLDNVGVQYGLQAFNDGVIDFDRFAELNELVGGFDMDGNLVAERTVADPEALGIAYRTGRVNSGAGGLADIPIIDFRRYRDPSPDIHDRVRSFSARERLIAANGHADNHVVITSDAAGTGAGSISAVRAEALRLIDEWLAAIGSDTGPGSAVEKVVRNKPADAVDSCLTPEGERIVEPATFDGPGACNELYPSHADPRIVAGAPVANDVLKCQLKAVDEADYTADLSENELDRLMAIFPDGVCDYTRPGIGQQPLAGTWLRY